MTSETIQQALTARFPNKKIGVGYGKDGGCVNFDGKYLEFEANTSPEAIANEMQKHDKLAEISS